MDNELGNQLLTLVWLQCQPSKWMGLEAYEDSDLDRILPAILCLALVQSSISVSLSYSRPFTYLRVEDDGG